MDIQLLIFSWAVREKAGLSQCVWDLSSGHTLLGRDERFQHDATLAVISHLPPLLSTRSGPRLWWSAWWENSTHRSVISSFIIRKYCSTRLSVAPLPRGGSGLLGCQGRILSDSSRSEKREDQQAAGQVSSDRHWEWGGKLFLCSHRKHKTHPVVPTRLDWTSLSLWLSNHRQISQYNDQAIFDYKIDCSS